MKALFLVPLALFVGNVSFAGVTPEYNAARLKTLQENRVGTVWTCRKGDNPEAVVMFKVHDRVSGMVSRNTALAIQDKQICEAVGVVCPYVGGAYEANFRGDLDFAKFKYWSTLGKYEDTVAFFSDGRGMKIAGVSNGSQSTIVWGMNWYFNEGECIAHF